MTAIHSDRRMVTGFSTGLTRVVNESIGFVTVEFPESGGSWGHRGATTDTETDRRAERAVRRESALPGDAVDYTEGDGRIKVAS